MEQLDPLTADRQCEMIVVHLVGAAMTFGVGVARLIELPPHDQAVQPVRRVVAVEPPEHIAMRNDARPRDAFRIGLLVEQPRAQVWSMWP